MNPEWELDIENPNRKCALRASKMKQAIFFSLLVLIGFHLKSHVCFCRTQSSEKDVKLLGRSGESNQEGGVSRGIIQ